MTHKIHRLGQATHAVRLPFEIGQATHGFTFVP
jgi:hypothetical protein